MNEIHYTTDRHKGVPLDNLEKVASPSAVQIIDNFLDKNELEIVIKFINDKKMNYGHTSGYRETINNKFFSYFLNDSYFNIYLKNKIENTFLKKLKMIRNYMHVQTFGLDGGYHTDSEIPNSFTFCLYITDISDDLIEHTSGDFLLKIPNEKFIMSIDTNMNRGIFFPSPWLHKGLAYNNLYSNKRLCITWKLEEIL